MEDATPSTETSTAGTRELVQTYNERVNAGDVEGVLELCTENVTLVWPVDVFEGKSEARRALQELFAAFPDFRRETDLTIVDGVHAATEFRASGAFEGGPFAGYQPTGKGGTLHGSELVTTENGKLARVRVYYDQMEFAREVGLLPDEDSPGGRAMAGMINAVTKVRQRLRR